MSKFYCMCKLTGSVPKQAIDSQGFGPPDGQVFLAPNRFRRSEELGVVLQKPMTCVKNGVAQYVLDEPAPNSWPKTPEDSEEDYKRLLSARRHHPNVDLYRCPRCGNMICVE